jgi:hypothetical protein
MAEVLEIVIRESTGPIDTPWGADLRRIEDRVRSADEAGIIARWESGRHLLKRKEGKQLPHGLLDEAAEALNVSRRELEYRVKCAETFDSEEKVRNALRTYRSWRAIIRERLTETSKPRKSEPRKLPPADEAFERAQKMHRSAEAFVTNVELLMPHVDQLADDESQGCAYKIAETVHAATALVEEARSRKAAERVSKQAARAREKRREEPKQVKSYLDATQVYSAAVRRAVETAEDGFFSPEAKRFLAGWHESIRKGLDDLEEVFNG